MRINVLDSLITVSFPVTTNTVLLLYSLTTTLTILFAPVPRRVPLQP